MSALFSLVFHPNFLQYQSNHVNTLILLYCEMTGLKDMQSSMEFLNVEVWHFHNLIPIEI